jgi:RNA polymerase sigma factor (sigma-70 family)
LSTFDDRLYPGTRELLDAALAGRSGAERRLWEIFHPLLVERARRHASMRLVSKLATPEDVANEVWVRVLSSRSLQRFEYRGPGSLASYLGAILDRTMVDNQRRLGSEKRARGLAAAQPSPSDDEMRGLPSFAPTPSSDVRAVELLELCERCLGRRQWTVFRMSLEGCSAAEIGDELGIPASSVRRILSEARERIREELDDS